MKRSVFKKFVGNVLITVIGVAVSIFIPNQAAANEKINAAVVAGFIQPFQKIASAFEEKTGVKIEVTFTSAGRIYGQIINGAPYDIFLSADMERPELLYSKTVSEKPFIYARGEVILWSLNKNFCVSDNWRAALRQDGVKKIAIANPETAVHGERAKKALQDAGLWDFVASRLVYAPDLAQVFQYATEGAVDAAFCSHAHSYTERGEKGCYYEMKEAPDVVYSACVLKSAKNFELTNLFAAFLNSPEAEKIKKKYGYKKTPGKN
jgi:molybdate transport system substrate-binding protein